MKSTLLVKQVADISEELKYDMVGLIIEIESNDSICLTYNSDSTLYSVNCSTIKDIYHTLKYIKMELM